MRSPFILKLSIACLLGFSLFAAKEARAGDAKTEKDFRSNILMIRKDGEALNPLDSKPLDLPGHYENYDRYIDRIFDGIREFCRNEPKPCQVLLYFHGGLNTPKSSVRRAIQLTETIQHGTPGQHRYPIFVNWNSSLPSTWWDHVAHIKKGLWQGNRLLLAVPYFIAADEVRSIAEAPSAWVAEARHTFPPHQGAGLEVLRTYQDLLQNHQGDPKTTLALNDLWSAKTDRLIDDRKPGEIYSARAKLLYSWWSKLLAPPLLIQAAGTGAWDVMERRTAMLFRTEAEFRGVSKEAVEEKRQETSSSSGTDPQEQEESARKYDTGAALARFVTRFQAEFLPDFCGRASSGASDGKQATETIKGHEQGSLACEERLQITLVGHSMGTIIVDRLLRYAPNLKVKNIVFMGAANTVEDYRDTIDTYLDRHQGPDGTNMYHLVLHPLAEVSEQGVLDFAPRGSLLIWIDNYFTNPPTPLGRRAGRFTNIVPELLYTDPGTRSRVHLKVFRVGRQLRCWNPQKHGDFDDFPFWDQRFWDPTVATDSTSPVVRDGCRKSPHPSGASTPPGH